MNKGGALRTQDQVKLDRDLRDDLLRSFSGDQEAYKRFLGEVSKMVNAYLRKNVFPSQRDPARVEDLVQEVLLAIHLKRGTYKPDLPILPWIYSIARYRLIDSFRSDSRSPCLLGDESEFDSCALESTSHTGDSIQHTLDTVDTERVLAGLNEKQREILTLSKIEELPLSEVATRLGMTVSAVKVSIHRSLALIRKRIKDEHK